jgi:hypothetical protein
MTNPTSTPGAAAEHAARVFALLPPIFAACVTPDAARYDLALPFVRRPFVYATDGRILVRAAANPAIVDLLMRPPGRRVPNAESLFADPAAWKAESTRLPMVAPPTCPRCEGVANLPARDCDRCDGAGAFACCECGQDRECPRCGGKGKLPAGPCNYCDATGYDWGYVDDVGLGRGTTIAARYACLLLRHGAVLFLPVAGGENAVRFTAGDVEGLLMPLGKA